MDRSVLPVSAFIDPNGANLAAVTALAQRVLTLALDDASHAERRPPLPVGVASAAIPTLPECPGDERAILDELATLIAGCLNPAHPGCLAHMDPPPTVMSILGDLVAAVVNNNLLSLEMAPSFSRLEQELLHTFGRFFGLGDESGGVLVSGGSMANLHALALARNVAFNAREQGIVGLERRPVVLASKLAHTSIHKAAMMLGLGTNAVVEIEVDEHQRLDPDDLEHRLRECRQRGQAPFCVVATAGTTVTGSIDPLPLVADIAQREGLWFHVDAAYGGALQFSDRRRSELAGIERADSLTFNPQKWLCVTKTSAMVLFRRYRQLDSHFRIGAPYMADAGEFTNLGEISVQGTRHPDVLKLWLSLRHIGRTGYEQLVDEACRLAGRLAEQLAALPFVQLAAPTPDTSIVCFRGTPDWLPPGEWDAWNARLQQHLLQHEQLFLSLPVHAGGRWLKAVILNPYFDDAHVQRLIASIEQFAEATGPLKSTR
ncbi:MAG TPA: aminotransferase class V-fold PLP-dependent enzyme [Planctomycetaceae bacterium]|nr:aminotransferase class V-fold PLP-dependent enzyme [Planctomycetaceae bacterium]